MIEQPVFEVLVGRLHIAVLIGPGRIDRAGRGAQVRAQREILGVEAARGGPAFELMRGGRAVVALGLRGHAAQAPERILQARLQRQARFRLARHGPLPVRIRQHHMAQQVRIRHAGERDAEFVGMRQVDLHARVRLAHLREKHFLRRTILRAPARHPALKGAQRPARPVGRQRHGPLREQMLEQRLGLEFRRRFQPTHDFRPDGRECIRVGLPVPRRPRARRPVAALQVAPCRFPIHARFHRCAANAVAFVRGLHEVFVLVLGDQRGPA
ncbi:MAG: hypothetical protein RLZZ15_201 [Verrucomicrobiota bacterium]